MPLIEDEHIDEMKHSNAIRNEVHVANPRQLFTACRQKRHARLPISYNAALVERQVGVVPSNTFNSYSFRVLSTSSSVVKQ